MSGSELKPDGRVTTVTQSVLGPLLSQPHQPRLTYYDAAGNRTELSTASLENWSAKVAGLLLDELGARPGDLVRIDLPPGWLHLPILLGAWWAGLIVTAADRPDAVAAFVADGADAAADEVFVVSDHPLGAPAEHIASHQHDAGTAIRPQADRFTAQPGTTADSPALADPDASVGDILRAARPTRVPAAPRLLSAQPWQLPDPGLAVLLAPLAAGGSLVQLHPELAADQAAVARIVAAERVTHTAGLTGPVGDGPVEPWPLPV